MVSDLSKKDVAAIGALSVLGVVIFCGLLGLWRAFVLVKAWSWLVVPSFGARPVTVVQALVLGTVAQLAFARSRPKDPRPLSEALISAAWVGALAPAAALGLAWALS